MTDDTDDGNPEHDSRVVNDDRLQLTRDPAFADAILSGVYPRPEWPTITTEQDAWLRAAEERIQQARAAGPPPDIQAQLVKQARAGENIVTLLVPPEQDVLVAPQKEGATALGTERVNATHGDEIERMCVDEHDPETAQEVAREAVDIGDVRREVESLLDTLGVEFNELVTDAVASGEVDAEDLPE